MKQSLTAFLLAASLGISGHAQEINVGIYGPGPLDTQEGIYLALESSPEISETRYVKELSPEELKGLNVLIVPQVRKPGIFNQIKDSLREWVAEGHGVMTIHDAVGFRSHPNMFPEFADGVGNPFNKETGYGKFCIVAAEHPALSGFQAPTVIEHGYFDQVIIDPGPEGVVLVREALILDETAVETGVPVIMAGTLGKGRYIANGLAIGYDETATKGVPRDDELKLFINLVKWLAGEGDAPATEDIGAGVRAERVPNEDVVAQKADITERIEKIAVQAIEPWDGKWHKTKLPPVPKVKVSEYKNPVEFQHELLKQSDYTGVAQGWTRVELKDDWKYIELEGTEEYSDDGEGTKQGFQHQDYDDSEWEKQHVPKLQRTKDNPFTGIKWYRRAVEMPAVESGQRVVITFTKCGFETKLWVNGKYIGARLGGSTSFEFDITDAIKPGEKNLIAVRTYDIESGRGATAGHYVLPDGSVQTKCPYYISAGHLWGKTYITVKPELYSVRTIITPHLADSEIEVDTWLFNPGPEREISMSADVTPAPPPMASGNGRPSTINLPSLTISTGANHLNFRVPMNEPVLWNTENPYLYTLKLKNDSGTLALERFGFREFGTDGPYFLLNGEKINLIAHPFKGTDLALSRRIQIYNEDLFMTKYLLSVKNWNANTIYTMAGPHPRQFYNLCDELGLMVYADWNAAHGRFPNSPMIEGWNKGEGEIETWLFELYNHPSLVMWSLGAELYEGHTPAPYDSYTDLLNPVYDRFKLLDKQNRPVCPSSGRPTWMYENAKSDIHDFHAYPAYLAASWPDQRRMIVDVWRRGLTHKPPMPVIQYEMGGGRMWNQDRKELRKILEEEKETGRIDRVKVVELLQPKTANYMGTAWISALYGFRRFMDEIGIHDGWRQGAGWQRYERKNVGQVSRIAGPLQAGFAPNTEVFSIVDITEDGTQPDTPRGWFHMRLGKGWTITDDLSKKQFVQAENYLTWQRINNPEFICMDQFDRNMFAGGELKAQIYAINDIDKPSPQWIARCVIRDSNGKILSDSTADIGRVSGFKRKILPFSYSIPENLPTGFYNIDMYLYADDRIVSDNYEHFYVLGKQEQVQQLKAELKTALYDTRDERYDTGISTRKILDELKTPYTLLKDFEKLSDYDVLIIGAGSMDETVRKSAQPIRDWAEKGGRLLQFEQHVTGTIPYYRKLRMLACKPHIIAEIIEANHPVFNGLDYRHMDQWNVLPGSQTPGDLYRQLIGPIDTDVLASGALDTPRNSTQNNQMVMSETVMGEGRIVLSQFETTQRYGTDSVATRLIWNMLEYITGGELWNTGE